MSTLFLEPFSGLAGDVFLAALLDLDDPRFRLEHLRELADALVPGECTLEVETVRRGALVGRLLTVRTPESDDPPHRHLAEVLELLERAPLAAPARARAASAFRRIAVAEARVHGTTPERVHFHEVSAVDSLVDVAGAVLALERLGVTRVLSTPPLTGEGTVACAHGVLPVPAPGTAEILRGLPCTVGGGPGERLTPTGAALLAELVDAFEPPVGFTPAALGYGAGHREFPQGPPNLLRVQLGEESRTAPGEREAWLLEFNLDDLSPEAVGFCVQELRAAGALEVWTVAAQMKKDRPGAVVSALCRADRRAALERVAFLQSTTLGVRWTRTARSECEREARTVDVLGRPVRVVLRRRPDAAELLPADVSAEHDDLAVLAREHGLALSAVERLAIEAALARGLEGPGR